MERGIIRDFEFTMMDEPAPVDHLEAWKLSMRKSGLPISVMPANEFDQLVRHHTGRPTLEVGRDY